jgi:hypothetical protein
MNNVLQDMVLHRQERKRRNHPLARKRPSRPEPEMTERARSTTAGRSNRVPELGIPIENGGQQHSAAAATSTSSNARSWVASIGTARPNLPWRSHKCRAAWGGPACTGKGPANLFWNPRPFAPSAAVPQALRNSAPS